MAKGVKAEPKVETEVGGDAKVGQKSIGKVKDVLSEYNSGAMIKFKKGLPEYSNIEVTLWGGANGEITDEKAKEIRDGAVKILNLLDAEIQKCVSGFGNLTEMKEEKKGEIVDFENTEVFGDVTTEMQAEFPGMENEKIDLDAGDNPDYKFNEKPDMPQDETAEIDLDSEPKTETADSGELDL